jgi:hypothetical protein
MTDHNPNLPAVCPVCVRNGVRLVITVLGVPRPCEFCFGRGEVSWLKRETYLLVHPGESD